MQLDMYIVLALALIRRTLAVPDGLPTQTAFVNLSGNLLGYSPKPTGRVERKDHGFFQRRATTPGATCGYISGNFNNPITCDATAYCAANTIYNVFGCCDSYSPLANGDFTFSQCVFRSRCIDYTASNDCTGTCATNTLNGYCTDSNYPNCQTFSLTDLTLSAFACNSITDRVINAVLTPTTTYSFSQTGAASAGASIAGVTTVTVGPSPSADGGSSGSSTSQQSSGSGKSSVVGPAVGGAIGGLAVIVIAVGLGFWLRLKHNKNKQASAAAAGTTGANTAPGAGPGPGSGLAAGGIAGGAAGAYGANEYFKTQQDSTNNEPGPPMYPGQQMTQTYPPNQNLQPNRMSEMPSSPAMTAQSQSTAYNSQQPLSEIDGNSSTAPQSPLTGGAAHMQRKSLGTNSLVSGSGGDKTELDSTSISGQQSQAAAAAGPTGTVPSAAASTQPPSQSGLGYQAGPVSDWNRPYHELE